MCLPGSALSALCGLQVMLECRAVLQLCLEAHLHFVLTSQGKSHYDRSPDFCRRLDSEWSGLRKQGASLGVLHACGEHQVTLDMMLLEHICFWPLCKRLSLRQDSAQN